ncbi:MAG: response regulator [Verrucomicrobiales bacterium]|nr:response regulator [Verrucomicrobiales bacterium]
MSESLPRIVPRVLVLDDNEDVLRIMRMIFNQLGYDAIIENQDEVAVARFEQSKFDLVIQDYSRDRGNGATFLRKIRELEDGRSRVPVIFVTGQLHETVIEGLERMGLCFEDEVSAFIAKPFEAALLMKEIKTLLGW